MKEKVSESANIEKKSEVKEIKEKKSILSIFLYVIAVISLLCSLGGNIYSIYYQYTSYMEYTKTVQDLNEDQKAFDQLIYYNSSNVVSMGEGVAFSGMLVFMGYAAGKIKKLVKD
ncbi:MAG: hypothetical protein IJS61_08030 [Firmicutes bacterium]|nr:hypothetical protein [Bacillota bacterium]